MTDPTKPYELTFDKRLHYLYAHLKADVTNVPTALEYWKTIIDKCRELNCDKLMVVQEIPDGISTASTYTVASNVAEMGIQNIKIAFVDPYIENFEHHQFGELVASNRGAWSKVFTTAEDAENWLLMGNGR